ncbi:hypothetical protein E4U02_07945 [Microbacterium paludicola]|uniref:Uncharacterized protein n=1 Tax=Microbacterium paludicola TaxID=300019 RepID=A0A4Y9FUU5_9MICO|nr:hypothetical protein [Microbacterium paludicola]MBF0816340.1 hypothetical protein [Microbacterium paludicola]TFU33003.1 hypothetical protein E4U02_07945 [Microbacterium paludicola]
MTETDELDALLAGADPTSRADGDVRAELERMSETPRRGRLRRFPPRAAVATVAAVLVLGGGTAAAAATGALGWQPWAEDPDAAWTYTVPSGATCELRVGNLTGAEPEVAAAVREFYATHDVLTDEAIAAVIEERRAGQHSITVGAEEVDVAWDDPRIYDADDEYTAAVHRVASEAMWEHLEAEGIALGPDGSYEGESHCE